MRYVRTNICLMIVAGLVLISCGTLIKPHVKTGMVQLEKGSYKLDQTHVTVLFKINHMSLSTFVGRFNRVDASLEFDPTNIAAAKLSAIIDVTSIDVNNPVGSTLKSFHKHFSKRSASAKLTKTQHYFLAS
jgi:polyisoprenoid-binding protein YceI